MPDQVGQFGMADLASLAINQASFLAYVIWQISERWQRQGRRQRGDKRQYEYLRLCHVYKYVSICSFPIYTPLCSWLPAYAPELS